MPFGADCAMIHHPYAIIGKWEVHSRYHSLFNHWVRIKWQKFSRKHFEIHELVLNSQSQDKPVLVEFGLGYDLGPLLLTWINFNPSMDK